MNHFRARTDRLHLACLDDRSETDLLVLKIPSAAEFDRINWGYGSELRSPLLATVKNKHATEDVKPRVDRTGSAGGFRMGRRKEELIKIDGWYNRSEQTKALLTRTGTFRYTRC